MWGIEPAGPLTGDVDVAGSKNAVTKFMAAAVLGSTPSTITNAPRIGDVDISTDMLRAVGAGVALESDTVVVDPTSLSESRVPVVYSALNRFPVLLIGPLLHRIGEAFVPLVGGDRIGARPIDYHVNALRALGAEVELTADGLEAKATRLRGARIRLPMPSVGATETVLLTAALADGRTVLENAAIEPEVVELALFLQRMGARIELRADRCFIIEGVRELQGARQRVGGDRIEAFSYMVAGVATGGRVRIRGCHQDRLVTAITTLQRMGARFEIAEDGIVAEAGELRPAAVKTSPHPGFMTDWQSALVVLFTQVEGLSVIHETVFEDRLVYVDALRQMGAEIELYDQCLVGEACRFHESQWRHSAVIRGRTQLRGAEVEMPDIRWAFACVLAAAVADGSSVVRGIQHLERGYDHVYDKFTGLGLRITPLD